MPKKNEQSDKIKNNENAIPIVADIKMHSQEKPISDVYCVITMVLMMFLLPAGIMDGILACSALVLILTQYYGNRKIEE